MKLTEKIKNEHGVVTIDRLRKVIQDSISNLIGQMDNYLNYMSKKANLIVEYYIMHYYRTQEIDGVTYEELLKNIELVLSLVSDTNVINKHYNEILWWVIYRLFEVDAEMSTSFSSDLVSNIYDIINYVEVGEYPKSCLDLFPTNVLEECINQMYLIMMSDFVFGKKV